VARPPVITIVIGRLAGHMARKPPYYYSNNRGLACHVARKPRYYYSNNRSRLARKPPDYYSNNRGATWPANLPITIVITGPAHYAKRPCDYYSNWEVGGPAAPPPNAIRLARVV